MTLAALLVVGTGLAVAAWGLHAGDRQSVVSLAGSVSKGQVIGRNDLVSTSVSGVSGAIPVADLPSVVGQTAAVDLVPGQVLLRSMLTSAAVPGPGQAVVGMALDPARIPGAGLAVGDQVDVIAVPGAGAPADPASLEHPQLLTRGAQVYAVDGELEASGQQLLTLVVDAKDATRLAAYSAQNRVAVLETTPLAGPTTAPPPSTPSTGGGR